uniref:Forkhead-associated (FHA) phosphopeptide binding domain 1 n=1 Tax=Cyprinus carpio TaxID=7962 RepID=A0A8C1LM03_CYPCA
MKGYLKTLNWVFKLQPKSTTIGRHKDSDLCLQNSGVDECHATVDWCEADGCYAIRDLSSAHWTYVNDCRIHNATVRLSPGDQLHFGYGGSTYELCIDSEKSFPLLAAHSPVPQVWVRSQKEQRLHRLGDGNSQRKDDAIVALKEEVSALKLQLSQKKQGDPDVTYRLCCLESDIKEKKDQIQQLKQQMLEPQRCSGEMLGQAVTERDQKISSLLEQMDKVKNENNSSMCLLERNTL